MMFFFFPSDLSSQPEQWGWWKHQHGEGGAEKEPVKLVEENGTSLECTVSDRHPHVQKFIKESKITQYYDVWQFEKGNIFSLSSFI